MSEPDPIRWVDRPDVPDGVAELVRSLDAPPPLPPEIRTVARPRFDRAPRPPMRWIAPTTIATAVVIGGLLLWRFQPVPNTTPVPIALAPDVQSGTVQTVDEGATFAPTRVRGPAAAASEGPPITEVVVEQGRPPVGVPDDLPDVRLERAPPRAPGETAFLVVITTPSSRLTIDGRDTGLVTPVLGMEIPAGTHVLSLLTEDGERHAVAVHAEPGQRVQVVRSFADAPPAAPGEPGFLTINTMPWARVFLDGRDTGQNTPVRSLRVPAGRHTIGLRTDDGTVHTVEVSVHAGETERIVRQLDAPPARRSYDEDEK